ncbi:FKBP-type peptidyl-prolyl cis-trans isomerase [Fulvivirgaceae bacterium PWU20]|uniref:Peptidyl-prolyl cis-trans isomerase n=2 Tax=Chryseosolibacter indicus TaxID=2782351 RepID=A0ABS5VUX2_9BACT|nr:FKBP-type peptidyl-prolyl cis-trans isomerase [Chryseosolibacter indicus]
MKVFVFCIGLFVASSAVAQSKKELQAEIGKLKAQITELQKPKEADLSDTVKKASYGVAVIIGSNIKSQGFDSLNVDAFVAGIRDFFGNKTLKQDREQSQMVVQRYMEGVMERKTRKAKEEGLAFLEANKSKEGVKTTASGLQYKVISSGTGKTPKATDNVTVHYTGKLTDGTVFDSSVQRGEPASFGVSEVIRGWTEALQLMKEGDKWILYIPSDLGYGERGAGGQIPPFSTLIFEVELIKVN